jgi:hypothetical protein
MMMVPTTPVTLSRQQSHQPFPSLAVNMKVLKRLYMLDNGALLQQELLKSIDLLCSQLAEYYRQQQQEVVHKLQQLAISNTSSPSGAAVSGRRTISREFTKCY